MTAPIVPVIAGGRKADGSGAAPTYTLVYDGTCSVCGQFVSLLQRWNSGRPIEKLAYQDAAVPSRFPWISATAYAEAMQLIGPGGRTWQGAAAVEQLLRIVPRGWILGWIFRLPAARWLADRFYRWFARNRYRFGCGKHCELRPSDPDYDQADS